MNVALLAQVDTGYKFEPETLKWIGNIKGNNGTVSGKSVIANDVLVKQIKNNGLRSSIQYLNTHDGNNLAAAQCPIIYDIGSSVAILNGTAGGWTYSQATGLSGNGTDNYLDLGFTGNQVGSTDSYHLCFNRDNAYGNVNAEAGMGTRNATTNDYLRVYHQAGTNPTYFCLTTRLRDVGGLTASSANLLQPGCSIAVRLNSTTSNLSYKPRALTTVSTGDSAVNSSIVGITGNMYEFAQNGAGTPQLFSAGVHNFVSVGYNTNLTTTAQRNVYRAIINQYLITTGRTAFQ